jgi:hypothetical protein
MTETDPEEVLKNALLTVATIAPVISVYGIRRNAKGELTCTCGGKPNCSPGKHPILKGWQSAATSDTEVIQEWLLEKYPQSNYGVPTGFSAVLHRFLIVVDGDLKAQANGVEWLQQAACEAHACLDDTVAVVTGSGGRHWYYTIDDGKEMGNRSNVRPGLDVRGAGGYVLGAGSRHYGGGEYAFLIEPSPDEQLIAECPQFLMDLLVEKAGQKAQKDGVSLEKAQGSLALEIEQENKEAGKFEFIITQAATPPKNKFYRLWYSSPKFRATIRHKRPDLHDQSFSGYMMSLVGMTTCAGWSAQESVDLLVQFLERNKALTDTKGRLRMRRTRIEAMLTNATEYAASSPKPVKPLFRHNQGNLQLLCDTLKEQGPMTPAAARKATNIAYEVLMNLLSRWSRKGVFQLLDDGRYALISPPHA